MPKLPDKSRAQKNQEPREASHFIVNEQMENVIGQTINEALLVYKNVRFNFRVMFYFSLANCILGFFLLGAVVFYVFTTATYNYPFIIIGTISSVLLEFIAGTVLTLNKNYTQLLTVFGTQLTKIYEFQLAEYTATKIEDQTVRDRTIAVITKKVIDREKKIP